MSERTTTTSRAWQTTLWFACASLLLMGCAPKEAAEPAIRTVNLGEFTRKAPPASTDGAGPDGTTGAGSRTSAVLSGGFDGEDIAEDEELVFDEFLEFEDMFDDGVDRDTVIDSLIGQINGRPVFADEFFVPIEDQLMAESQKAQSPQEFMMKGNEIVSARLRQIVRSELLLAEAESRLSPQQHQGIVHWMRSFQEDVISSKGGGTRAEAEAKLRDEEGSGVEEYVESMRDQVLSNDLYRSEIVSRVLVSWRDVQREYNRQYDFFNPPATVTLARIRIRTRKTEEVDRVKAALAAGVPFAEVAESAGESDSGVWQTVTFDANGVVGDDFAAAIKDRIAGLEVGETSEAFTVGKSIWWLHATELNRPPTQSIYDPIVQRQLAYFIRQRMEYEQRERYFASLMERGVYDDIEIMRQRLLQIAMLRYAPK